MDHLCGDGQTIIMGMHRLQEQGHKDQHHGDVWTTIPGHMDHQRGDGWNTVMGMDGPREHVHHHHHRPQSQGPVGTSYQGREGQGAKGVGRGTERGMFPQLWAWRWSQG